VARLNLHDISGLRVDPDRSGFYAQDSAKLTFRASKTNISLLFTDKKSTVTKACNGMLSVRGTFQNEVMY